MTPDYSLTVAWWIETILVALLLLCIVIGFIGAWISVRRGEQKVDDFTSAILRSKHREID